MSQATGGLREAGSSWIARALPHERTLTGWQRRPVPVADVALRGRHGRRRMRRREALEPQQRVVAKAMAGAVISEFAGVPLTRAS